MGLFDDVSAFHRKFGVPRFGDGSPPRLLDASAFAFRLGFILEESVELCRAHSRGDIEECADALADLVWVALGTAHMMGIPFDVIWNEVRRANMQKVRAAGADDPRSKRNHAFDIVKPAGWEPPCHREAIVAARKFAEFLGGSEAA